MSQGDVKSKLFWNVTNNERRNIHTGPLTWEHKSGGNMLKEGRKKYAQRD